MKNSLLIKSLFGAAVLVGSQGIVFSQEENIVSEGNQILELKDAEISLRIPEGWKSRTERTGLTASFEEAEVEKFGDTLFKRNITLSMKHSARPIDEKALAEVEKELSEAYAKNTFASEFLILDKKLINLGDRPAILMYSQMNLKSYPVAQAHLLMSTDKSQYLFSYTDLAERFKPEDEGFTKAWSLMTTAGINGKSPKRYAELLTYAPYLALALVFFGFAYFFRKKKACRHYDDYSDSVYEDGPVEDAVTRSEVWVFDQTSPSRKKLQESQISQISFV